MSSYTTSTTVVTAVVRPTMSELVERAIRRAEAQGPVVWVSSGQLAALTEQQTSSTAGHAAEVRPVTALRQRHDALTTLPMALALVQTTCGPLLEESSSLLVRAEHASQIGDGKAANRLADRSDALLTRAVQDTTTRLRIDERRHNTATTRRVLDSLGYRVDSHHGRRSDGIEATRGDTAVLLLVEDGGAMTIDWAGCAGDACATPMQELIDAMAAEGVQLHVRTSVTHGDDRGGQLVSRAGRAAVDGRRAVGVVIQHEQGVPTVSSDQTVATPARERRRVGEAG